MYSEAFPIFMHQIIDDTTGNTLVSASTLEQAVKEKVSNGGNVEAAKKSAGL